MGRRGARGLRRDTPPAGNAIVQAMVKATATICFTATLLRLATRKAADWTFLLLPAAASARLPTRSTVSVEGTFPGQPFHAGAGAGRTR
jgi:hypothetical protein